MKYMVLDRNVVDKERFNRLKEAIKNYKYPSPISIKGTEHDSVGWITGINQSKGKMYVHVVINGKNKEKQILRQGTLLLNVLANDKEGKETYIEITKMELSLSEELQEEYDILLKEREIKQIRLTARMMKKEVIKRKTIYTAGDVIQYREGQAMLVITEFGKIGLISLERYTEDYEIPLTRPEGLKFLELYNVIGDFDLVKKVKEEVCELDEESKKHLKSMIDEIEKEIKKVR